MRLQSVSADLYFVLAIRKLKPSEKIIIFVCMHKHDYTFKLVVFVAKVIRVWWKSSACLQPIVPTVWPYKMYGRAYLFVTTISRNIEVEAARGSLFKQNLTKSRFKTNFLQALLWRLGTLKSSSGQLSCSPSDADADSLIFFLQTRIAPPASFRHVGPRTV